MQLLAEGVQVGYDSGAIVHGMDITFPAGRVTTIIGPNGCGKSTLLKALTRIIPHQGGHVTLDGLDIRRMETKALARKMAILPQTPENASGLLVEELVTYGRFPHQKGFGRLSKEDRRMIDWALDVTRTAEFRDRPVDALSGGQRQRVWIAMALAQDTGIIFLDEPTTYLDMAHQLETLELLRKLNRDEGRTIIMVLHDLNQAARFSDHLIALSAGRLIKSGTPEEVLVPDVLKQVFNIDAVIGRDPRTDAPLCITYDLIKGDQPS
ncbi:ABC transporter ATP-binding protein [Bhargavaea cecembensis]|uniref:ABC transporter ATP-binding protein n=1 Tax=Bhargavaea cecembensis TaxID=394098 RepID=UPI00058C6E1A|nr:ABC transporter ATP-binding protein [Bhargavaea cecembensis]